MWAFDVKEFRFLGIFINDEIYSISWIKENLDI